MDFSRRFFLATAASLPAFLKQQRLEASTSTAYQFSGPVPRAVLENYLSHAVTMRNFWVSAQEPTDSGTAGQYADSIRMLTNVGAKHVAFTSDLWWGTGSAYNPGAVITQSARIASDLHAADPDIIVGGAVFEVISSGADAIAIPAWVFAAFGIPVQTRNFNHLLMLYPDQRLTSDSGLPAVDITQLESRMWYYYWAKQYIDIGFEHLDMGQIQQSAQSDRPHYPNFFDVVRRIRQYAAVNARRKWMLISAQTYPADGSGNPAWDGVHGVADASGNLLFDYYYQGGIAKENAASPQDCVFRAYGGTIFGRSLGGIAPSGWACDHLPYTIDLDPGGNPNPGVAVGYPFQWGWCEPGWFMNQPDAYRANWIRYAVNWIRANDPNGHFRPLGQFFNVAPQNAWYHADTPWYSGPSSNLIYFKGFNDEPVIKEILAGSADPILLNGDFSRPVLQGVQVDWIAPEIPSWTFGSPIVAYGSAPTDAPIPSGQTARSMSGIATAGSQYAGSITLAPGQQVAFILGSGSLSQAVSFPGGTAYALQFSASQRVSHGTTDSQEIQVLLDGSLIWRYRLSNSIANYNVYLGAPSAGTHTINIAGGSTGTDTAIVASARIVGSSVSPTAPVVAAVVNAASGSSDVAPGSLITIYGSRFASAAVQPAALPLPTQLGEVVVSVNGIAIPLLYCGPNQINAQVPFGLASGPVSMIVDSGSESSAQASFTVAAAAPEVFRLNASRGLAFNQDGSINGPAAPAPTGSVILCYVTGQGEVDHAVATGAPGPVSPLARPLGPVNATLGDQTMNVLFLGLAPGLVGVCQANLLVPNLATGDHNLVIQVGNAVSQPVTITVGQAAASG